MNGKFDIRKLSNLNLIVSKCRNIKGFLLRKSLRIFKLLFAKIKDTFLSLASSQESREIYNFNQINTEKNLLIKKSLAFVNRYTYKVFPKFDLIFISFYLFKLEQSVLKLLILGNKYDKAISYSNKLFLKYPNFSTLITDYYIYILKKHTYRNKKSIEYFSKINGLKKGIIYIVDSHSSKGPTSLIYSTLNKFKGIRTLGIEFNLKNLKLINDISDQYGKINLHLTSIINKNININNKLLSQLKKK